MFRSINKYFSVAKNTFQSKDLQIVLNQNPRRFDVNSEALPFGAIETDHILEILYEDGKGWSAPKIKPFGPIQIHPFNSTLHYAVSCFEGMKAFKGSQNELRLFRPERNLDRFLLSCEKISLPKFDKNELFSLVKSFVRLEHRWVPSKAGCSMYLRPMAMSMGNKLGVHKPGAAAIYLMACPVGSYFK
jgi:branched-chain amino acid aminotransferase